MFPFWEPYGWFFQLGWLLLLPFVLLIAPLWWLWDRLFPPGSLVRRLCDWVMWG